MYFYYVRSGLLLEDDYDWLLLLRLIDICSSECMRGWFGFDFLSKIIGASIGLPLTGLSVPPNLFNLKLVKVGLEFKVLIKFSC